MDSGKQIKHIESWLGFAKLLIGAISGLIGVGVTAALFYTRLAKAEDLQSIEHRTTVLEQALRDMKDDLSWTRDQVSKIGDAIGAEKVPRK